MIADLDEEGLMRVRHKAEKPDVLLEVHGGGALGKCANFEERMQRAALLA